MKYLLSILILFSGLSFAEIDGYEYKYLICDDPYYFYPDLSKRKIIEIVNEDTEKDDKTICILSALHKGLALGKGCFKLLGIDESEYRWEEPIKDPIYNLVEKKTKTMDRITGKYGDLQCKSVDGYDSDEAHGELIQYAKELKAKRKI